ncbi:MAG: hypothetical protein V1896_02785 [Candidatus Zambryskibacteria bacterium]
MNNILNLKKRVMARIYIEYTRRFLWEHPDYLMFALFLAASFMLISIHDVLNNVPKDNLSGFFNFFVVAIRNTSLVIQILIAGFLARVVIGGGILAYKNINTRWPIAKLIRFRY